MPEKYIRMLFNNILICNPINKKDKESIFFSEGKSCHHCFNRTSLKQKKRFSERQKQIILSKIKKNKKHIGP